jgi:hypothetical protein
LLLTRVPAAGVRCYRSDDNVTDEKAKVSDGVNEPSSQVDLTAPLKRLACAVLTWTAARNRWLELQYELGPHDRRVSQAHFQALVLEEEIVNAVEEFQRETGEDGLAALGLELPSSLLETKGSSPAGRR